MSSRVSDIAAFTQTEAPQKTAFKVLLAISFCHLLNDMSQSLLPALYPILKQSFRLTFSDIGLLTLTFQATASLLQPVVGFYTDRRPTALLALLRNGTHAGSDCCCCRSPRTSPSCCWPRRCWASDRRCSIPSRRGSRASPRADSMDWRSRCFKSEEMRVPRWDRCSRPSSSSLAGNRASPGSRSRRCSGSAFSPRSADGTSGRSRR